MKAKERKRLLELTRLRAKKNRSIAEMEKYVQMLQDGRKVVNGPRGFLSVSRLYEAANNKVVAISMEIAQRREQHASN